MLPILAFPATTQAIGYLLAFAAGTIVSMAAFSTLIGLLATRCSIGSGRAYRGLMSACSVAAICVGCFWLFNSFQ